jgi:hypothetical protein
MGAEMNHREEARREYRAPRLAVLGTVKDLTRMPPQTGQQKETHPVSPGSKLT